MTSDVVRAGYNLLHNRSVDDSASISSSDCLGGAICQTWTSPQEESEWAVRVLTGQAPRQQVLIGVVTQGFDHTTG